MLLTVSTTHEPATDQGLVLRENPGRVHTVELPFGGVHTASLEVGVARPTAASLVEVDVISQVPDHNGGPRSSDLSVPERFVAGEPLYRVHECVFGVLALESEPVDPRL